MTLLFDENFKASWRPLTLQDGEMVMTSYLNDYRNFFGIAWRGEANDNLKFAKQMGYDYISLRGDMKNNNNATDMKFYIESPEYRVYPVKRMLDTENTYSSTEIKLYETYFAWKKYTSFPDNIATGYWDTRPTKFSVEPDFQQQTVIDYFVERIITYAKSEQNTGISFTLGGFTWDVPDLTGDFMTTEGTKMRVTLAYWTGIDSSVLHPGITHEYSTYSDGRAAYYKRLRQRTTEEFGDAKFIMEPSNIYNDWISKIKNRGDAIKIVGDLVVQEIKGTEFVDDSRIFDSDLITKNKVGSTTPDIGTHSDNLKHAAKAAINGAWFGWYGRFGGTGDMPDYKNIYDVPARLQLIRVIPNWENVANVPLSNRSWDGSVYQSYNSYISGNIIYSRHPKNGKIFVVFLNTSGKVKLFPGEVINSIQRTDNYFIESGDGRTDVTIIGDLIQLNNTSNLNKGYILAYESSDCPTPQCNITVTQ